MATISELGLLAILLLATGAVYFAVLLWLWLGLGRLVKPVGADPPSVSVIVAARNEADNIEACLEALRQQQYAGKWEVILVDDRSEDGTGLLAAEKASQWPLLKLVQAPATPQYHCPKKSALAAGIAASTGQLLLFTDADCRPRTGWIAATVRCFSAKVGLVAGWAEPANSPLLRHKLLALDNLAIGALTAGSLGMGAGLACTGRNLAYRRQVYQEVDGFASIGHLLGGDDVYFMRLVQQKTNWQLVFNPLAEAQVHSDCGPTSFKQILRQKLRHAAKAGNYTGDALLLAALIYGFHFFLLIGLIQWARGEATSLVGALWLGRWLADGLVLSRFCRLGYSRLPLLYLPLMEILYIPYILIFSAAGRLGWFRWKG